MPIERVKPADIGVAPIAGPFSYYLNQHETAILIALTRSVAPRVMIEFGCNVGLTAKRVLCNVPSIRTYIGIDVPPHHQPKLDCQQSEVPEHAGCFAADDDRFFLLMADHELTRHDLEPCDAAFIDGDHSAGAVHHDSELARELIRPGGIICWHDHLNKGVEVTPVLEALCADGWPIKQVAGSWIAFMRT
jgi:predicted O-methyltransferase YrrM